MPIRNVLVCILDDTPWDALEYLPSVTGHARAIAFPNSFQSTPLCAPTRATFFTGLNQRSHGVSNNADVENLDDSRTFATSLAAMGVSTYLSGKYENENATIPNNRVPPGWHQWHGTYRNIAYQVPTHNTGTGQFIQYKAAGVDRANLRVSGYEPAGADSAYSTDVIAQNIEDFITAATEPWMAVASFTAPHDIANAATMHAPRHAALYPSGTPVPKGASFDEADVSDKPAWVQALPTLSAATVTDYEDRRRAAWRALKGLDEAFAHLLTNVVNLDDTLVLVLCDNSNYWGEHRFQGKIGPHEESIQMMLHAFHPDVTSGRTEDALVSMLDMTPTICAAFGAPLPWKPDHGRNIIPVVRDGEPSGWRTETPIEWSGVASVVPEYLGIRTKTHKYVEYVTGEVEMYDLTVDPGELTNLAGVSQHAATQADLAARLERYR